MKTNTKKLFGAVVCTAAVLAFTTVTTQAANLLVDPGFEAPAYGQPNPIPVPGGVGGGWAAFQGNLTTTADSLWASVLGSLGQYLESIGRLSNRECYCGTAGTT